MEWLWITLGVLLFLVALFFLSLYVIFRMTFSVPAAVRGDPHFLPHGGGYDEAREKIFSLLDRALTLPYEDVWTESRDGLRLHGRYFLRGEGLPVRILVHGYRGSAYRDFAGGLEFALESGNNVLLIDQRGHGESQGKCLSFGVLERFDVLSWIDFVREKAGENTPVILSGLSMGAATVLMAAALPLPRNVRVVIADSGYTSPREIISKVIGTMKLPPRVFFPLVRLAGRLYGGFDVDGATAEKAVTHATVPIFFVHGEADDFVPCEMTKRNYVACRSEKQLLTVPGAGHGLSFIVNEEAFRAALSDFFGKHVDLSEKFLEKT